MNLIYKLVLFVEVSARSGSVLSMSVRVNVITDINIFVQALSAPDGAAHPRPGLFPLPIQSHPALCGEQGRGVCAVCDDDSEPRRDLGDGATLVGPEEEGCRARVGHFGKSSRRA